MENIQRENADILDAVWAVLAQTVIPPQPVSGQAYRNAAVEQAVIQLGQKFNSVADSALFNQFLYLVSNYGVAMGRRGILPWISAQEYRAGGLCIGPDGSLWQAQQDIEAGDTTVPGTDTSKWDVPIFNGQKVFSLPPNGQPGQFLQKTAAGTGWADVNQVPGDGQINQVLAKSQTGWKWRDVGSMDFSQQSRRSWAVTFLNGLVMQGGNILIPDGGITTISFLVPYSRAPYCLSSQSSNFENMASSSSFDTTTTNFKLKNTYTTEKSFVNWFAIGRGA